MQVGDLHTAPSSYYAQMPLVYGCAANGTIVTIAMGLSEAKGQGAGMWWGPEAVAEPCVRETLATT